MQKDKINSIVEAYKSMYAEDVQSEARAPIITTDPHAGKKLLSKLPGAHGRYVKSLEVAHDHHMSMHDSHNSMVKKLKPLVKVRGQSRFSETEKRIGVSLHKDAAKEHKNAAGKVKKLIAHAKKNKLTAHPENELHKDATRSSFSAQFDSDRAIRHDKDRSNNEAGHVHKDHTKKLQNSLISSTHKADRLPPGDRDLEHDKKSGLKKSPSFHAHKHLRKFKKKMPATVGAPITYEQKIKDRGY